MINVIQATEQFIHKAREIAHENADIRSDLLQSMEEVKRTGNEMADLSKIFADDPCSKSKREQMITAARALLASVTRLLILADRVDIQLILKAISLVEKDLQQISKVKNQEELIQIYKQYRKDMDDLNLHTQRRQQVKSVRLIFQNFFFFKDLVDRIEQENLAAARATIKRLAMMLLTSSKVYLRHPESSSARENRDFVHHQLHNAVHIISSIIQGQFVTPALTTVGDLIKALNEFDVKITFLFNKILFIDFSVS